MEDRNDKKEKTAVGSEPVKPELDAQLQLGDDEFPLERYRPLNVLGTGTVGTVYLCRDRLLQKRVAVKVLKALTAEQLVAFQQEARATSRLSHRNIVKVLDFGATSGGVPFMVMEYVEGVGLDRVVREHGPLEPTRALPILIKICDALEYAHSRGTFHRDVKSANVLVVDNSILNPGVRLIDFGVASIKHGREDAITVQGRTIVGTPQYMSPDQCSGLPYDESSEIYSFGCAMFEALSGRVPFTGATALETIAMHANEPAPKLKDVHPDGEFDTALETVVARCLAKKPEERYPSMAVLKADLEHCLSLARQAQGTPVTPEKDEGQQFPFLERETIEAMAAGHDRDPILTGIMIGLVCFSLASFFAYWQIERIFSNKKTTTTFMAASKSDLPAMEEHSAQRGFVRSYVSGKLEIQAKTPVVDDDLKELAGDPEAVRLTLLAPTLSGRGFEYLSASKIAELTLIEGNINDAALNHLQALKNLSKLELIACRGFTMAGIESIANLPLERLAITNTNVGDAEFRLIAHLPALSILDYSADGAITSGAIALLAQRGELEDLTISCEQLDDAGYEAMAKISSLRALTFAGKKKLKRENLIALSKMPQLRRLGLSGGAVSDEALLCLQELGNLRALELKGAAIRDNQIRMLRGLKLRRLSLMETAVTDQGLLLIKNMPELRSLRLRGCPAVSSQAVAQLSKSMPECQVRVQGSLSDISAAFAQNEFQNEAPGEEE